MKQPFFHPTAQCLLAAIMTFCVALGCVWPLSLALGLTVSVRYIALCCAGISLLFLALDCLPRLHFLAYPAVFAAIFALAFRYRDGLSAVSAAVTLLANGQPLALTAYSVPIATMLALLFASVGASLAQSEGPFFSLALLSVGVLLLTSLLGVGVGAATMLPLILAMLLASRAQGVSPWRALACSAAILLLCLPLLPLAGQTVPELADLASDLRQKIDDYLFFTDARTTFSLSATGWQPLGSDQLGGPVSPSDEPVMQVQTGGHTLLRGTIKNEYTGSAWRDSAAGRRYLLVNPRFIALRRNLFDLNRPSRELREQYLTQENISVLMLTDAASTLYLTQRFGSLSGEGVVPYYSPASEVFATRSLAPGDSYSFTGSRFTGQAYRAREAVLAAWDDEDPYLETVSSTYTQLPAGIEEQVYAIVRQLTAGMESAFDRALALCRYLQTAYPYTLEQNIPPAGRDFVSWFLITERQGYCTSFASAMTVMARIAGLPARYIEGYAARPDADGIARVTQQNAHAWSEVYFPGFGWLAFDPTPSATGAREDESWNDLPTPDDTDEPDDPDDPNRGAQDTPTPSPTPTPTPDPTPSPTPTATPSPTPEHNDPAVTPTPELTPEPTPTPSPVPADTPAPPPNRPDKERKPPLWLLPLMLLAAAGLCALRLWLSSPQKLVEGKNAADALYVWYRAVEDLLTCMGIAAQPGEAPATYLTRAQEQLSGQPTLEQVGRALYAARFSGRKVKQAQVDRAAKAYEELLRQAKISQKLKLYMLRLKHGARL